MDQNTAHLVDYSAPVLLLDRLGRRASLGLAAALILLIGGVDLASGYALRQSPLYLAPVAIAAWTGGARWGMGAAALASLFGLAGLEAERVAAQAAAHDLWKLCGMLGGFALVVWLMDHLRQALSQADERFVRMLEGLRAAIYVVDEERQRLLYANPEMQRLESRLADIGPLAFEAQFIREPGGDDGGPAAAADFASQALRHAATGRWYQLQEASIPWGSSRQVKLKVLSDVTPRKNAQIAREERRESVHQVSRLSALAETASTLAHEINQPLTVIATYTDACQRLMQAPPFDHEEIIAALGKCHAQAVRAGAIVERLRDFIPQRRHQPAPWPVAALVDEAVDVCRSLLEGGRVRVDSSGVDGKLVIVADRILLVQLLVNLIRNAIDAMRTVPEARRRLTIAAGLSAEQDEALISVADQGCGLSTAEPDEMFAPFFTTKDEGLGLGLAICRSVAESHNGRLWAAGNAAGGATFVLAIPAESAAP